MTTLTPHRRAIRDLDRLDDVHECNLDAGDIVRVVGGDITDPDTGGISRYACSDCSKIVRGIIANAYPDAQVLPVPRLGRQLALEIAG